MKCPYCAEDIQNEAIVCRYCNRDLYFYKPIDERFQSLETQVVQVSSALSNIQTTLENLQSKNASDVTVLSRQKDKFSLVQLTLPVVLSVLISFGLVELYVFLYDHGIIPWGIITHIFFPIILLTPTVFGYFFGHLRRGSHLKVYIALGLAIGVIEIIIIYLIDFLDGELILIVLLGATFSFTAGGLIGDFIKRRRFPVAERNGFPEKLAAQIISNPNKFTDSNAHLIDIRESQTKSLANLISALAPILALIGTILAAYLSHDALIKAANVRATNDPKQTQGQTLNNNSNIGK